MPHEPFGDWSAGLDDADCLNDLRQTVFRGHACRSLWNAALQSTITAGASARVAVGQACSYQDIGAQAFKFRVDDQVHDALREMRSGQRTDDHHRSDYISFSNKEHREQSNSVDDRRAAPLREHLSP